MERLRDRGAMVLWRWHCDGGYLPLETRVIPGPIREGWPVIRRLAGWRSQARLTLTGMRGLLS